MLPFLKKKEAATTGMLIKHRSPDETPETEEYSDEESNHSEAIEACAKDLLTAIESKDHKAIANALADAFVILEQNPHKEVEHEGTPEPHSYDAQNKAAASKRVIG